MKKLGKSIEKFGAFTLKNPNKVLAGLGLATVLTAVNHFNTFEKNSGLENTLNSSNNSIQVESADSKNEIKIEFCYKKGCCDTVKPIVRKSMNLSSGFSRIIQNTFDNINSQLSHLNGYVPWTLDDEEIIKAMIGVETTERTHARYFDPMQVSNKGDYAIASLKRGVEGILRYAYSLPDVNHVNLAGKKKGRWNYTHTGISPDVSIKAGIWWLTRMRFAINSESPVKLIDRGIEKAIKKYNGRGDPDYFNKFIRSINQ